MNARQLHQLEWMQRCCRVIGERHTAETFQAFKEAVVRQQFRDDSRRSADLFDRIQSDNRPQTA